MATLASTSMPSPPPFHRRRKSWARRIERICCTTLTYFPLTFVYGLTTWAIWVEVTVSFLGDSGAFAYIKAGIGAALYALANASYTIAVFTNPGSPLDPREDLSNGALLRRKDTGYEGLPTQEDDYADTVAHVSHGPMTTVTAKSTGQPRYCKKCQCVKPDRAHHCSTCQRCVLKMDHHCPWLATCVGLRNYKPFLLFLIYVSLFCWLCFTVSSTWVWAAVVAETHMEESLRVVNCIMLAVLGGIIGVVLTGFTAWHIYLAITGQTTIESLDKTRYLSPLRKTLEPRAHPERNYRVDEEAQAVQEPGLIEHLKETHANALPGVLRPEEGEESSSRSPSPNKPPFYPAASAASQPTNPRSPARAALQRSYASLEAQRERERYRAYLDEQDSEKLPNAFNLGWRRNLAHVFGPRPLLWPFPVCNTAGDGWMWAVSPTWLDARADAARNREARDRADAVWLRERDDARARNFRTPPPPPAARDARFAHGGGGGGPSALQMQPLDRRKGEPSPLRGERSAYDGAAHDVYDTSSDENERASSRSARPGSRPGRGSAAPTANWNDVPDDLFSSRRTGGFRHSRSGSRGRRKGD